ncbi:myosin heavy chain, clone 203-like [Ylistrum balloti]|uniref:myosin heavy chain, clone 203-like n=1 Tax=Ylistrum balloti TaxID=509963 RepID=UPI0029059592|nr:myosin heavy chain, clone 203-like [Ylistrum balloti]
MNHKTDWEGKVSSLLRETQSNLSRMKKRAGDGVGFRGYNDWKYRRYSSSSPSMRKFSSMSDISPSTSRYPSGLNTSFRQGTQLSTIPDAYESTALDTKSYTPSGGHSTTYTGATSGSQGTTYTGGATPMFTQSLQEKLDQQNKLIDQLMQMVHKLESERNNYGEQIRDIRGEIQSLGGKMYDKNSDNTMERRMEQVKREMLSEIHVLQNQVQMYRNKGDNQVSDIQVNTISRDMMDMKHTLREEMETVRRDVEVLKSRLMKIELDMSDIYSNRKDIERRQDRIDQTVQDLSSPAKTLSTPYWSPGHVSTSTSDKLHMSELRSTIATLKNKVDNMEASVHRDATLSGGNRPYTQTNGYRGSDNTSVMDLEELNLSDDDETSLDTFIDRPVKQKKSSKTSDPENLDLDSDEDLDLEDLDLSDDDTVSLESQHF